MCKIRQRWKKPAGWLVSLWKINRLDSATYDWTLYRDLNVFKINRLASLWNFEVADVEKTVNIDFIFRRIFKIAISMDTAAVKQYTTELQSVAYKQEITGQNELHYLCGNIMELMGCLSDL